MSKSYYDFLFRVWSPLFHDLITAKEGVVLFSTCVLNELYFSLCFPPRKEECGNIFYSKVPNFQITKNYIKFSIKKKREKLSPHNFHCLSHVRNYDEGNILEVLEFLPRL